MSQDFARKRVTVKHKHPNPLFEQWLTEWRDKAKEQESKMQHCFTLALRTLKQYPLPLESGKDCKILKGFGEKLCKMLDDKLKQYKAENAGIQTTQALNKAQPKKTPPNTKSKSPQENTKEYVPKYGSGAFAILVTLYEKSSQPEHPGYMTKEEIIEHGQHMCNVSFTKSGPDSRYTGWSSMKTLLEKNLVFKRSNPAKFSLTKEGSSLADQLYVMQKIEEFKTQEEKNEFVQNSTLISHNVCEPLAPIVSTLDLVKTVPSQKKDDPIWGQASTASSSSQSSTVHECVIAAPNSFQVILLVDTQELNGSKGDAEHDPIIMELKNLGVSHEVRNLKLGDYSWICRDNFGNEWVLPYIVERKRMDDFGSSIKDNRFHEQKFRLRQCGIQNVIYLVESYGKNEHVGLPINTLYQAAVNTLVHDGFTVKHTENTKRSCEYLESMTTFLTTLFEKKTLVSCLKEDLSPLVLEDDLVHLMLFKDFNKNSAKSRNFKVTEMFARQLLQIKGMSVDKALAIIEKYPTPKLLKTTYNKIEETQREKLLSNIRYGRTKKNLGPVLSQIVYQFFCRTYY